MMLVNGKVSRRLFLGILILTLALAATSATLGQGTAAADGATGAPGAVEECGPMGECVAGAHGYGDWTRGTQLRSDARSNRPAQAGGAGAAAQEDDAGSPDVLVWSAMMTVGKSDIASIGYLGFVTGDWPNTGSIDNIAFSHDGVNYIVTALYHPIVDGHPNHLFLHMDKAVPDDLNLRVGPDMFAIADADVLGLRHNIYHWYLDSRLDWEEGDEMPVALMTWAETGTLEESLVRNLMPAKG